MQCNIKKWSLIGSPCNILTNDVIFTHSKSEMSHLMLIKLYTEVKEDTILFKLVLMFI